MFKENRVRIFNKKILDIPTGTPQPKTKSNQGQILSSLQVVSYFKANKAMGHDEIGNLVLRKYSHTFSLLLAIIFQICLNKGIYLKSGKNR